MSARRLPIGLLAPVALVVLVSALGALQYRWVGQVSERERDQRRQSLERRARDFAGDFDREIGRAYQLFRPEAGFLPGNPDRFVRQYDEWRSSSAYPGLVKTAYFAEVAGTDFLLHRFDPAARAFEAMPWPDALQPIRTRLATLHTSPLPEGPAAPTFVALAASPVMANVPALLIPESQINPSKERRVESQIGTDAVVNMVVTLRTGRSHVVLELDRAFITSQLLPALAERHFPETGADSFRMSVMNNRSEVLYARGLPAGQIMSVSAADAVTGFFSVRVETFRGMLATPSVPFVAARSVAQSAQAAGQAAAGGERPRIVTPESLPRTESGRFSMIIEQSTGAGMAGAEVRSSSAGWTLLLQHSAGSLDAIVAQARRRNLFLSFGILGVLAASAGLVMINARRAERLAAQQMDFVATVSHELRTPLAVIRSAAQNLSAGVVHDAGQARRYGDLIESEGRRLTDMVEQVLEYAGLSDARRRPPAGPVDVASVVRDVAAASASLAEAADVAFDVRIDQDVPAAVADETAIRRALHNLIGNALKYAGDGRWVGLHVARGRGADEGFVLVSVIDRGRGIPAAELPHVFEPFYRGRHALDRQIRGNGLGLSLVKRVVESLDGRVSVTSVPDEGSTFTLHLPVASGAPVEAAGDLSAAPQPDQAADSGGRSA
jgi:signal transduction histidine kinase